MTMARHGAEERLVRIPAGEATLEGDLAFPPGTPQTVGVVLFAHGSGSSRHSPRNRSVAAALRQSGLATLLMDLLTADEERVDMRTAHLRFDIPFLARRLVHAIDWLTQDAATAVLPVGCFGASTGGGAALVAAAARPERVKAVVSRGGRPDLAAEALPAVLAPTLLIVGGADYPVIEMNQDALRQLRCEKELVLVPRATHLFEEPGAIEEVARLTAGWFVRHLK